MQSFNRSYDLYHDYEIEWNVHLNKYSRYYVYFHFAEIQKLAPGLRRIINITLNDENILSEPITLEYMKPVTISNKNATQGFVRFSIRATAESDAPPILNAFEVYKLVTDLNSPTDIKDGMYVFHLYIYIYIYLSILLFNHQQICFHQFLGSYTVTHNCIWKL